MADEASTNKEGAPTYSSINDEFPSFNMPVAYADSITSLQFSGENFKMYFSRNDGNVFGKGGVKVNPFAQLIMPPAGFMTFIMSAQMTIADLVEIGIIKRELYEQIKQTIEEFRKSHPPLTGQP